jgi:isoleucyl-tRNA synthetase
VIEALVRWLAPIISFTADEIWQVIPGLRSESVLLETWYSGLFPLEADAVINAVTWDKIMSVRTAVSKELEQLRSKGAIGASLNAEVELYCDEAYQIELDKLTNELHFVFITSNASVSGLQFCPDDAVATDVDGVKLKVTVSAYKKCVRCWHQRYDIGEDPDHPELCGRRVQNVVGDVETRHYA